MQIKSRSQLGELLKELNLLKYPAAEIGVAEGRYSKEICEWGVAHLYMVDTWRTIKDQVGDGAYEQHWHSKNKREAIRRTKGLDATLVEKFSVEAAKDFKDESLGFVYLDACHTYLCVRADLKAWFPKLVKGGIMAGHDFHNQAWYGVEKAVRQFSKEVTIIPENELVNRSFYFKK